MALHGSTGVERSMSYKYLGDIIRGVDESGRD